MAVTTPRQFRLDEATMALLEALRDRLGLSSRAEVIRFAVAKLANDQGVTAAEKSPKNKIEKK